MTQRSTEKSRALFAEALQYIPGGVNSPVRAFRAVGGEPFFVDRAEGCHVHDVDGNSYIDYVGTWGPAILGHAPLDVIQVVKERADHGTSFGIPNPLEVTMARMVCELVPSVDMVRMCNSGTEATMSAVRLARGYTGRDKIIKFAGCYHGHVDSLLVKAGSGALTLGQPDSAGIPADFARNTIVLPFNDIDLVKDVFEQQGKDIAGIILEPVPANAGLFLPRDGYLEQLREVTRAYDSLLIFDEVMTGFRLGPAGAQGVFGVQPDLSCFGKVIGGGLPVGAFGGRKEVMSSLAPLGPVYQAGTLSGNPLAMAAGVRVLEILVKSHAWDTLESLGSLLEEGFRKAALASGKTMTFHRIGSMFCGFFTGSPVNNLEDAMKADTEQFARFFHGMLDEGVCLAPSQFETGFLSTAHDEHAIGRTVDAVEKVLKRM